MSAYHSQHGEDKFISEVLKPGIGTFCEVGAYDGVLSSNTLHFEELGWTGILVEADPYLAAKCQENRKAPCWCCAVGLLGVTRTFYVNKADRGISGLRSKTDFSIPVLYPRLDFILRAMAGPINLDRNLDLLSIDTEGTELEVWESIGTIRPRIVIMEYRTCGEPPQDVAIVDQMTRDGYKEAHRTLCNLIFVRQ